MTFPLSLHDALPIYRLDHAYQARHVLLLGIGTDRFGFPGVVGNQMRARGEDATSVIEDALHAQGGVGAGPSTLHPPPGSEIVVGGAPGEGSFIQPRCISLYTTGMLI